MNRMKARYEIQQMNLKVSNVTLPNAEDSYVLIKATDENHNEIIIELSHEQAEDLQNELYEANRRREHTSSVATADIVREEDEVSIPVL